MKDLVSISDLSTDEIEEIFILSSVLKTQPEKFHGELAGKTLGLIFRKPSTRTRVSFEAGMAQLGGTPLYLSGSELQLSRGESVADTARVLSRYLDAMVVRTFAHQEVVDLATHASIPVINGLDDLLHPCQALCDYFTIREIKGKLKGVKLAYVGDGNNVAHSLIHGAVKCGVELTLATPEGYRPSEEILKAATPEAGETGAEVKVVADPREAVRGADVVYTDVWASMGQEAERAKRLQDLEDYRVDADLFALAAPDAVFMHCLPAHRGEEVTDEVADHPRSVIFDQAENRLHTQKALLLMFMAER